jgi:hypothetical protein
MLLTELTADGVRIAGINTLGGESGNALVCEGRDAPWLQDTVAESVWTRWDIEYRDVAILDADNVPVAIYNLTTHDLADPASYAELRDLLLNPPPPE